MIDRSHLDALQLGLSHERARLDAAKSDGERQLRGVWVAQYERQVADEQRRLGIEGDAPVEAMSDDQLLAELLG